MGNNFFTADSHFDSDRTLQFSKRPYLSVKEMNDDLIYKWNSIVKPDDIVYHLGDFGEFNFIQYLNGTIKLLLGNYERNDDSYIEASYKYNFEVIHSPFLVEILNCDTNYQNYFECVHEPSFANTDYFVLYGHVHEKCTMKKNGLNVGVDCHHFYPINEETILFYKNAIENHYDHEVWSTRCGIKV